MEYKLVAIDMDDTLLDDQHRVSKKNREVINYLLKQGINVVLASGRPFGSLAPYAQDLGIVMPIISANGSLIKCLLTDKIYHKLNLQSELAQDILEYGKENDYIISVYYEDQIATNYSKRAEIHRELKEVETVTIDRDLEIDKAPIKLLLHHEEEEIARAGFDQLRSEYLKELYITSAGGSSIEVMNQKATKGKALEYVVDRLNIDSESVIAIGNGHNDIPMFEVAGLSIAMDNSLSQVKEVADFVTKSNQEDGVAYALEKFIDE
ncbi:Cof-type HAD-IIB family hydrolase [Halanaerocella petrolearia]